MKKLLILSGKGGTGKTTTAAAFCSISKCKMIADCDVDAPNMHLILGQDKELVEQEFIGSKKAIIDQNKCINCGNCFQFCKFNAIEYQNNYQVNELKCEGCGVCEIQCPVHAIHLEDDVAGTLQQYKESVAFSTARLKMGRGNSGKLVSEVKKNLFKMRVDDVDIAIIDGSPGIGCPVMASISGVDLVLIVAEPSISGYSDMERIVDVSIKSGVQVAICVNKSDINIKITNKIHEFCKKRNLFFSGDVPYDPMVPRAINSGRSIDQFNSPASKALLKVYENVMKILIGNK